MEGTSEQGAVLSAMAADGSGNVYLGGIFSSMGSASASSLPGEPFYHVKRLGESAQLIRTHDAALERRERRFVGEIDAARIAPIGVQRSG